MEEVLRVIDLGRTSFDAALRVQKECLAEAAGNPGLHFLIFCSHHPVITCGTSHRASDILADPRILKEKNIDLRYVNRGGGVSYHGPGQITVYPVCNLACLGRDIGRFLGRLEECVLAFLGSFGIAASRREGLPGVWTDNRKICSIGVAFSRWVSFHGLSVNIRSADMQPYSLIRPCGMDIKMTCLEEEAPRARELAYSDLLEEMKKSFLKVFWPRGIRIEENKR